MPERRDEEFFVGYLPAMPAGVGRRMRFTTRLRPGLDVLLGEVTVAGEIVRR